MGMIGHQRDGVDQPAVFVHGALAKGEEGAPVFVIQKNVVASDAAGRQMIERTGVLNAQPPVVVVEFHLGDGRTGRREAATV